MRWLGWIEKEWAKMGVWGKANEVEIEETS